MKTRLDEAVMNRQLREALMFLGLLVGLIVLNAVWEAL